MTQLELFQASVKRPTSVKREFFVSVACPECGEKISGSDFAEHQPVSVPGGYGYVYCWRYPACNYQYIPVRVE